MSEKTLTKQQQVNEIIRCGKDPSYFIKHYARIQHPLKGTIPFELYPFQDECLENFQKHRFNIVLKSRQLGLSTVSAAYATWLAIFYKDKNVLVIATKLATAQNFIKKVAVLLQSLPKWLLMPKFEPSKQQISFSNGSQIKAVPTSEDAGRSEALSLLIVDECAFIRDFDTIWTGLYPTLTTGGNAILISSPNGVGGLYYRLWVEAEAGANEFNPIRLPWTVHPEHDEIWFAKETRNLPKRKVSQEYLCDFITSGDTFLQSEDLEDLRSKISPPIEKSGFDRNVWIWDHPSPEKSYVISADVARGDASDYSAFHVIDQSACEIVAEYMGKIPPEKFAELLAEWGKKYNNAFICPENNTFGYFVNVKLRDSGYPRLYYHNNKGDPFSYSSVDPSELPGFPTNQKTRVQVLTKLEELIRNKVLRCHSQRLYDQLQAFIWNGNKPMASKDSHDDLIMSLAIGAWLVEDGSGANESAMAMAYAMLKATGISRRELNEIPNGPNSASPYISPSLRASTGINPQNVYKLREPTDVKHVNANSDPLIADLSWLYR